MTYYSQIGQDKYFIENINKGKRKGYFVDIGAHDGITLSNTYALESQLEWSGLCVEVCDDTFNKLINTRKCKCVNECVFSVSGLVKELEIPLKHPLPEGNDVLIRIKGMSHGFPSQFEEVKTFKKITKTLTDIFKENDVPSVINYMSIDIEGSDLEALKGLDFSKYTIEFLTIEWGGGTSRMQYLNDIKEFLQLHGYTLHRINNFDVEFTKSVDYINSFDVFDTLLARRVLEPCDIFTIIENSYPFPNFRNCRCTAQNYSNGTIDDIYIKFKELYNIDEETCNLLKEYEIETEMNNSYLITTNYNRVKDGDILISDMYLHPDHILKILNGNGFSKNITLYVSPSGKGIGTIWPLVKQNHNIQLHLGDNMHSDVNMAKQANINSEHTTIHQLNDVERLFVDNGLVNIALLFREFRHKNLYEINTKEYELYNDQASFNIPLLVLCSNLLYKMMKEENRSRLLLLTRDGCLLKHIFSTLYSDIECLELESSRKVNKNPNQEYKDYLKSMYNKDTCLIFDLFGSFSSGRELFKELFGIYPRVHLLGYNDYFKGSDLYPGLTYSSSKCYEHVNFDCIGSLIKLKNGIFIRSPLIEYDIKDAMIYKTTVKSFCSFIKNKIDLLVSIKNNNELLDLFISNLNRETSIKNNNFNSVHYKVDSKFSMWNHPSLTDYANALNVTKGTQHNYYHGYTEYYDVLFSKWYNIPCSILEIGLKRYGTESTPSLDLWKGYMGYKTKVYGFDSFKEFENFNNPDENLFIITGNEREPQEIVRCCVNTYDIIVEDSDHDSQSQQLMFKILWKSLNSGGVYCIESLHWQPTNETGLKTRELFMSWKEKNIISSEFISIDETNNIFSQIDRIEFYDSTCTVFDENTRKNALCCIWKK